MAEDRNAEPVTSGEITFSQMNRKRLVVGAIIAAVVLVVSAFAYLFLFRSVTDEGNGTDDAARNGYSVPEEPYPNTSLPPEITADDLPANSQGQDGKMNTYADDYFGFTIDYPKDWKATEVKSKESLIATFSSPSSTNVNLRVVEYHRNTTASDIESYVSGAKMVAEQYFGKAWDEKEFNFDSGEVKLVGKQIKSQFKYQDYTTKQWLIVIPYKTKVFEFKYASYSTSADSWDRDREKAITMLNSLRIGGEITSVIKTDDKTGTDFSSAIVIEATDEFDGTAKEYDWLKKNACPNNSGYYGPGKQELKTDNGRHYDIITAHCVDGKKIDYYFMIDSFFGKM